MSAKEFVKEVWGLQGTAYAVVALRYYAKVTKTGWASLAWDDLLMFLATLTYTAESVAAYFVVAHWEGFANNAMTDAERAALEPHSPQWTLRVNGSKTHVIGLLLYTTLLWLLKGAWVIYYGRLTNGVASRYRLVQIGAVMIPVTYLSCILVAFFKCIPFDHQWQINPNPGNHCMPAVSVLQTVFVMVMNTATDLYLMMIPIPMVWKAHLPWRKKATIILLFSGGFVELAFGLMRCISILTVGDRDPAQSGFWSVRESFVSFVVTNLPYIYPLIKGYIDKSRSSTNKSGNVTGDGLAATGSKGYRLGSLASKRPQRHGRAGSQEHIVSNKHELRQKKPSVDLNSSQDSVGLAEYPHARPTPAAGVSRAMVSSRVSAVKGPPSAEAGGAQGILVTRMYEVSED